MSILPARDGLPPRGEPNGEMERRCARTVNGIVGPGEVLCGKPAAMHIIWEEETPGGDVETGFACSQHAPEVTKRWHPLATHPVGPCCGMPGARYSIDENRCFYSDGLPTAEPVRAVAEPVPVGVASQGERSA